MFWHSELVVYVSEQKSFSLYFVTNKIQRKIIIKSQKKIIIVEENYCCKRKKNQYAI